MDGLQCPCGTSWGKGPGEYRGATHGPLVLLRPLRPEALLTSHVDNILWTSHPEPSPANSTSDTAEPLRFGCSSPGLDGSSYSPRPQSCFCTVFGDRAWQAPHTVSATLLLPKQCRHLLPHHSGFRRKANSSSLSTWPSGNPRLFQGTLLGILCPGNYMRHASSILPGLAQCVRGQLLSCI